jgi:hypothetical protein
MPLFLRNRLLFLHIPKCGGDTVTHMLTASGDPAFMFVADGSVMVNGHTPQHMTWREFLQAGWSMDNGFRVAALVRHPLDRIVSSFRYARFFPTPWSGRAKNPAAFLDAFLSEPPVVFDNHNRSILEFLQDHNGKIDERMTLRPIQEMDLLMQDLGLPAVPAESRRNVTQHLAENDDMPFSENDILRAASHYAKDVAWFEAKFPNIRPTLVR